MSKYNVGDKFIIVISKNDTNELDTTEYYITNGSRVYEKEELDRLQKYDEVKERMELIDELKMDEYNKGLEDGRNEVWELVKKIKLPADDGGIPMVDLKLIFGTVSVDAILKDYTPQKALAKLEAYEKEQSEIKVGDVVVAVSIESVVTKVGEDFVHTIDKNGSSGKYAKFVCKKTGKHIDISGILNQISE